MKLTFFTLEIEALKVPGPWQAIAILHIISYVITRLENMYLSGSKNNKNLISTKAPFLKYMIHGYLLEIQNCLYLEIIIFIIIHEVSITSVIVIKSFE